MTDIFSPEDLYEVPEEERLDTDDGDAGGTGGDDALDEDALGAVPIVVLDEGYDDE